MRVVFPYLTQLHQIPHSLPIAAALAQRHPDIEVHVAVETDQQERFVRRLLALHAADAPLVFDRLSMAMVDRLTVGRARGVAGKRRTLRRNHGYFAGFDAIVTPERTSLYLRRLGVPSTALIRTGHGAGDRPLLVADNIREFDFVVLGGDKMERRLRERDLIRSGAYAKGIYAKLDWFHGTPRATRLFDDERPTVLYNPHFRPQESSWPRWGPAVLDYFAQSQRYNLIFAPHLRLFDPPRVWKRWPLRRYARLPHIHVDLGSERSVDMSYAASADLYLGDVSSQLAEFLYRPRPCVFLNAHEVAWHNDINYLSWNLGPVVDEIAQLDAALAEAFTSTAALCEPRRQYFRDSLGVEPGTPSAPRAADAIAGFLRDRRVLGAAA